MDEKTFKKMLVGITVENVKEAHKIVSFFDEHITQEKGAELSDNAKGVLIAALLIEYGKQKSPANGEALTGQATD